MKKLNLVLILILIALSSAIAQRPYFQWVRGFGQGFTETDINSVTDKWGNIYIVGGTGEEGAGNFSDFHPNVNDTLLFQSFLTYSKEDIFITKMDADGNHLWTKYFGGNGMDHVFAMTIDVAGNLYMTGTAQNDSMFQWPDTLTPVNVFPPTSGIRNFIMKTDSAGNIDWMRRGLYATLTGGDFISITVGSGGEVYCGSDYGHLAGFDPSGVLLWSVQCPWNNVSYTSVAAGPGGRLYTSAVAVSSAGSSMLMIAAVDAANGNIVWQDSLPGNGQCYFGNGASIQYDVNGSLYLMGEFSGSVDFDPSVSGSHTLTSDSANWSDIFVLKLDTMGGFQWAKNYPGSTTLIYSGCTGNSLAIDQQGGVCMMSRMLGTSIDADPDSASTFMINCTDAGYLVVRLDSAGNFRWAFPIDNFIGTFEFISISIDDYGSILLSGDIEINTTDFDPGPGYATWPEGECFVLKINERCMDPLAVSDICIVTVDTVTGDNIVVWEKPVLTGVDTFNILKDGSGSGSFSVVGSVGANAFSTFTDVNSSQAGQPCSYALSLQDSCGLDYPQGSVHTTMHLEVYTGSSGDSLAWNAYEGVTYTRFHILSGTGPSNLTEIDSVAFVPGTGTYSYVTPAATTTTYYAVEIRTANACSPTARMSSVPYGFSRSNTFMYNNTSGIINPEEKSGISLYPNPAASSFIVGFVADGREKTVIELLDLEGRVVKQSEVAVSGNGLQRHEFDLNDKGEKVATGTYFVRVRCGERCEMKRLVVL
jgi:hypothetical protein